MHFPPILPWLRQAAHAVLRHRTFVRTVGPAKGSRLRPGPSGAMMLDSLGLGRLIPATPEQQFLEQLGGLEGATVYDVGGFVGELTLGFARKVGSAGCVIVFEPNPLNIEAIHRNLSLNRTCPVMVVPAGVGSGPARLQLQYEPSSTATGSLDRTIQATFRTSSSRSFEVEVDSLDRLVQRLTLPAPSLVKIDVEGLEGEVLAGMEGLVAQHHPSLYIELHGADLDSKRRNAERVVAWLLDHGYDVRHVESGKQITTWQGCEIHSGHLYSRFPN